MESLAREIMMLVFAAIGTFLTPFIVAAVSALRDRMKTSAFLNRIDAEGKMREGIAQAIQTALLKALAQNKAGSQAVETAIDYVRQSSPEYIEKLGMPTSVLRDKITAALGDKLGHVTKL